MRSIQKKYVSLRGSGAVVRYDPTSFSTYSIVARDSDTGQLGVAVQTHQMCVGAIVPWVAPGIGAIATQATANVAFGPMGLAMLREGVTAPRVIGALVASDGAAEQRQVAAVDREGKAAAWTGRSCISEAAHHVGEGYSVQANMMLRATVVPAMAEAYEKANGDLAERMLAALRAAQGEGGDIRGMQSAALKVVRGDVGPGDVPRPRWPLYDLRVDEHNDPLLELERLARLRHAQLLNSRGYVQLEGGEREQALQTWRVARGLAPELEEMVFWQAVQLADAERDVQTAAEILAPMLDREPLAEQWLELLDRMQVCGVIERPGAAVELRQALD